MNQGSEHKPLTLKQTDTKTECAKEQADTGADRIDRKDQMDPKSLSRVIFLCFFLSGGTGLIYEVVWARLLGLVFGNTVYAITTTVCAFMAGLALGGYLFGRWIDRKPFPLLAYGMLEILVGISVLVVPLMLKASGLVYSSLFPHISHSPWLLNSYRFFSAFLTLLVPTFFMGGTLPILSRFFVRSWDEISNRIGWLYAVNTLGATVGTLVAGFYMISHLGMKHSIWIAVAINLVIGLIALDAHKRWVGGVVAPKGADSGEPLEAMPSPVEQRGVKSGDEVWRQEDGGVSQDLSRLPFKTRLVFFAFALSGFVSLLYEIAWTRALTMVIGSSVYAFSLILSVFLVGIALGSLLFGRLFKNSSMEVSWLAGVELLIALFAFLTVPLYLKSFHLMLVLRRAFSNDFNSIVFVQLAICFLLLIIPTLLFGTTLPLAAKLCTRKVEGVGRSIGNLYAANTVGCILGSFLTGFLFLPWLTARRTVLLGVLLNVLIAGLLLVVNFKKRYLATFFGMGAFTAVVVYVFAGQTFYDPYLQNAGVFIYADSLNRSQGLPLENQLHTTDIVFYRESLNANISVERGENYVGLRTNGKTDASNGLDMTTQLLLGYLPALFHPQPAKALVIGFGSGTSVGAIAQIPSIRSIQVTEIEKAVMDAAPFFQEINHRVYQDPRLHVDIDDARNYLLNTEDRFDLILSEPSNPWIAGIGNLYTHEFYRSAAAHLAQNGIMAQWVQIYQMDPENLRMIIRTFGSTFRHISLWHGGPGDVLLLGSQDPVSINLTRLREWMSSIPVLREDFSQHLNIREAAGVLTYYWLSDGSLRAFARGGPLNTDDLPRLEFQAPQAMFNGTLELNFNLLEEFHQTLGPENVIGFQPGHDEVVMANTFISRNVLLPAKQILESLNRGKRQESFPGRPEILSNKPEASTVDPKAGWTVNQESAAVDGAGARLAEAEGRFTEAESLYRRALNTVPDNAGLHEDLGIFLFNRQRFAEAEVSLKSALSLSPLSNRTLRYLVETESSLGKYEEAIEAARKLAERIPRWQKKYQAEANLGLLYLKKGDLKEAEEWFQRALELDSYCFTAHQQLAEIYRSENRNAETVREYEFLVKYHPLREEAAFVNLSKLYAEAGKKDKARNLLRLGRRIFPNSGNLYHNYMILCAPEN